MTLPILAIGQSNLEGRYGPALTVPAHKRTVRAFDLAARQWSDAKLGRNPFKTIVRSTIPAHNLVFEFAHRYASICDDDADIVLLASGGKRIEFFLPGEVLAENGWRSEQTDPDFGNSLAGEIFAADGAAKQALAAAGHAAFEVLLIHQGEANFADPPMDAPEAYALKLRRLIEELERRGLIRPTTPIVLGEINPLYLGAWLMHRQALANFTDARTRVVRWDAGIECAKAVIGENNSHASGRGLAELGKRYFEAYVQTCVAAARQSSRASI